LTRLGVLVSGRGSNLEAILTACRDGTIDAEVVAVAANRECPALRVARDASVDYVGLFSLKEFPDAVTRDRAMADALQAADVNLVVCAGYDRVLNENFVTRFPGRILNVHPSLLPEFAGTMEAIREAFEARIPETGVTVHFIEPDTLDSGTIAAQEHLPILPGDTLETLEARVHALEHRLVPATIQAWIEGRVKSPVAS
jgi:phosphoribosylglycinamide formyltransferase-1